MNEFLKSGNRIQTRPAGMDYNLEPGAVYELKWDAWDSIAYLEVGSSITLPSQMYETNSDKKFINKILNHFKNTKRNTTGVILTGLKGSGKTVMSKNIAVSSGLPIIIVASDFPTRQLNKLFSKFSETEVCVIFDEVDKNERSWNTEDLLGFLDGINATSKKLVLLTCNNNSKMNEFIMNRCSRIRYYREFTKLDKEAVTEIVNSKIEDKNETVPVVNFIMDRFDIISYDNISSFVEELNQYPTDTFEELVQDLNISINDRNRKADGDTTVKTKDSSVDSTKPTEASEIRNNQTEMVIEDLIAEC